MNAEQLRQNAAAMLAFAEGKPIQCRLLTDSECEWTSTKSPSWIITSYAYRPAPEPVTRPWTKPDDVPGPVCWLRVAKSKTPHIGMIVGFTPGGNLIAAQLDGGRWSSLDWSTLGGIEHSTDRKTWLPCTVIEP